MSPLTDPAVIPTIRARNAVVMWDMGWWTVRARREYLRLAFRGKVVREQQGGVARDVYDEGRRRMTSGVSGKKEWYVETRRLLVELGLGDLWVTEAVGSERGWKALVKAVVGEGGVVVEAGDGGKDHSEEIHEGENRVETRMVLVSVE